MAERLVGMNHKFKLQPSVLCLWIFGFAVTSREGTGGLYGPFCCCAKNANHFAAIKRRAEQSAKVFPSSASLSLPLLVALRFRGTSFAGCLFF